MLKRFCHIVDDDAEVAKSTSFLLRSAGFETTIHASGEALLQDLPKLEYGCILLDVRIPGINGLDLQHLLHELGCNMPVVIITGHGDVDIAVRAMKEGALDFLRKPFLHEDLLTAVNAASAPTHRITRTAEEKNSACQRINRLTRREKQVLRGLVRGQTNKIIAHELNLSPRTIELYRSNAMHKLGVSNLSEMLHLAFLAELGNADLDQPPITDSAGLNPGEDHPIGPTFT